MECTKQVLVALQSTLVTQKDAETASCGNTLTRDDSYLEPYNTAGGVIEDIVQKLRELTGENPHQHIRFDTVDPLVVESLDIRHRANAAVARHNNGFEAAQ